MTAEKLWRLLKEKGIAVKSLNFKDMSQSDQYNPFVYIENYTDMVELITNIQTSVKPPDAQKVTLLG